MPTNRLALFDPVANDQGLRLNLDLFPERREVAALRESKYKATVAQHYNAKVRHTQLAPGDLVLRRNEASRVEGQRKFYPAWEGPYRVQEAHRSGSYKLTTLDGMPIPRTWHISNLRRFIC